MYYYHIFGSLLELFVLFENASSQMMHESGELDHKTNDALVVWVVHCLFTVYWNIGCAFDIYHV